MVRGRGVLSGVYAGVIFLVPGLLEELGLRGTRFWFLSVRPSLVHILFLFFKTNKKQIEKSIRVWHSGFHQAQNEQRKAPMISSAVPKGHRELLRFTGVPGCFGHARLSKPGSERPPKRILAFDVLVSVWLVGSADFGGGCKYFFLFSAVPVGRVVLGGSGVSPSLPLGSPLGLSLEYRQRRVVVRSHSWLRLLPARPTQLAAVSRFASAPVLVTVDTVVPSRFSFS